MPEAGPNGPVSIDAGTYDVPDLNTRITAALAGDAAGRPLRLMLAQVAARAFAIGVQPPPAPSLSALTLAASSVQETAAENTSVGGVLGKSSGSTLVLADNAGGRFKLLGDVLVTGATLTDYESATNHEYSVTIQETLTGATNSPRQTVLRISVTNIYEEPSLGVLALTSSAGTIGTATSGAITGATAGSTITAANLPTGLSINSAARTWNYSGAGSAGTSNFSLTETLGDSANSPRTTNLSFTIAATPTISLSAPQSKNEGNSGITNFTYTVTRTKTQGAINVSWSFAPGATSPADYSGGIYPAGGTLQFQDGDATASIVIPVAGDTDVENDETFTISITAPSGYSIGQYGSATGTILNDDVTVAPTNPDPAAISWGSAQMIGYNTNGDTTQGGPAAVMRKTFTPSKTVTSATLQATALGTYIPYVNGQRVGTMELTPGWTDYSKRRQFQTYDVLALLQNGANVVGVEVGDGWAHGNMSLRGRNYYGNDFPRAMVALRLGYADGTSETIVSDATWKASTSDNLLNDWYKGSTHDARLRKDWSVVSTSDAAWPVADAAAPGSVPLVKQPSAPARRHEAIVPVARTNPSAGVYIFDFGQNHAGYCTLTVKGASAGTTVQLRHAEDLLNSGQLYTANLRSASQTDRFTTAGAATEVFEPRHTFHGYRYVEVTGYPGVPPMDCLVSHAIYVDTALLSDLSTTSSILQKSWNAAVWAWKSNAITIPTDCPQRDERLGWSGDAHLFARSALFIQDTKAFLNKYCDDLDDSAINGFGDSYPGDVAPYVADVSVGRASWGDAAVFIPCTIYRHTGDSAVLTRHWELMKRVLTHVPFDPNYNDYLNNGYPTDADVFRYAFAYRVASDMKMAADVLGDTSTSTLASQKMATFSDAWNAKVSDGGATIGNGNQGNYILGLAFNILPQAQRQAALNALVANINANGLKLGFVSLTYLYDVLADGGFLDLAYQLAENTNNPSLGYQLLSGLTTTAEQWDPRGLRGVNDGANSYNHYVRGAVLEWIARTVAGIDAYAPGFSTVLLRPRPGGNATQTSLTYQSPAGAISTSWSVSGVDFTWSFTLPVAGVIVFPATYTPNSTTGLTAMSDDPITGGKRFSVAAGTYNLGAKKPAAPSTRPWTPDDLTALAAWWDPTTGVVPDSSGNVESWTDRKGGVVASQSDANVRPAYVANRRNGLPGIVYNPAKNNRLGFPTNSVLPTGTGPTTVAGARLSTSGGDVTLFTYGSAGESQWIKIGQAPDANNCPQGDMYLSAARYSAATAVNNPGVFVFEAVPGNLLFYENGSSDGTGVSQEKTSKNITSSAGFHGQDIRTGNYWQGDEYDIVVVSEKLSASNRQKLEGYLAWKWGLQALLPAGHPYTSAAPTVAI